MKKVYKLLGYFSIACFAFSLNAQVSSGNTNKTNPNFGIKQEKGNINEMSLLNKAISKAPGIEILVYEPFAGFPAGWSSVEIQGDGSLSWEHTTTGGEYGGQLASTSADNGYMMFNSDGYEGVGGEEVDLISESYDLSAANDPETNLILSFEHLARSYEVAEVFVYVSNDDFATETLLYSWGSDIDETNGPNPVISEFDITDYAQGQADVKFKFKWTGNWDYWWLIDDVAIIEVTPRDNDIAISNPYFGDYTSIPVHQNIVSELSADISNIGELTQTGVRLNVSAGTFDELSTPMDLDPEVTENFSVTGFTLNEVGDYSLILDALQDQTDEDPNDNSLSLDFSVSNDIYARDRAKANDYGGGAVQAGADNNYYLINKYEITDKSVASAIQFAVAGPVDANVDVVLFDDDKTTVLAESTGGYTIVAEDISSEDNLVLLEIEFDTPVTLNDGDIVYAAIKSNTIPDGSRFFVATTRVLPNSETSEVSDDDATNWLNLGEFGINLTGVVRLRLSCFIEISGGEVSYTDIENAEITGVSASGGTGTLSFSWEGPGDFTSEDEDISVTENGTYIVTVADENGCTATESYVVGKLSVADLAGHNINVYPNPASTSINFDVEGSDAKNIYVYDASGRSITSLDVNSTVVEFNVESLATGLYMYHITGQDGSLIVSSKFSVSK